MVDTDHPAEKTRPHIRGWLLVYAIGPAGFGILAALSAVIELLRYGGDIPEWSGAMFLLILYSVGLYLLIAVRAKLTRNYHIGFTAFMAIALAALAFASRDPAAVIACAGMSIWLAYWARSKRVRQTYCDPQAPQD